MSGLAKFKKALDKKGTPTGLSEITNWLSFDNMAMNWVCTGSFKRAIPNKRSILIGGESGATKTMNVLQLAKKAQDQGYHVVLLDSEASISEQDLQMNRVNQSDDLFTTIMVTTHDDVIEIITDALKSFDDDEKIMFILDSMTGLMTSSEDENFDKGKKSNDMGRIVQDNKKLLKMIGSRIRDKDWYFLTTSHLYLNQDITNGKGVYIFSNVGAAMYYPSLTLQLTKLDLKESGDQLGIRVNITTKKNRFFKLGQKIRLHLPYDSGGFNEYDGVQQILVNEGYIQQNGAWYSYDIIDEDTGEVLETKKFQSKNFSDHADYIIERYENDHKGVFSEKEDLDANLEMEEHIE